MNLYLEDCEEAKFYCQPTIDLVEDTVTMERECKTK